MVDENAINQILICSKNVDTAVKELMSMALDNGGKDNITIICIEVDKRRIVDIFKST